MSGGRKSRFAMGSKGQQTFPIVIIFYVLLIFAVAGVYYILSDVPAARAQNGVTTLGNGSLILSGNTTLNATSFEYRRAPTCSGDMIACAGVTVGNIVNQGFLDSDVTFFSIIIFTPLSIIFIFALANYLKGFIPAIGGA